MLRCRRWSTPRLWRAAGCMVLIGACAQDPEAAPTEDLSLQAVSAGMRHTCGLTTDGRAACWGSNQDGQLGANAAGVPPGSVPVFVLGDHVFDSISVGAAQSCGLTIDGWLLCWGTDLAGRVGEPQQKGAGSQFAHVSLGRWHGCALDDAGAASCWGLGGAGELGSGATGTDEGASAVDPIAVVGGLTFVSISAGETHTCAVTTNNQAYCWGTNSSGQLGDGKPLNGPCRGVGGTTYACSAVPVLVGGGQSWSSITTGGRHSCGVAVDGTGYCWGDNRVGQLGTSVTGSTCIIENNALPPGSCHVDPVMVEGGHRWSSIEAGGFHTCGITQDGESYCWGAGSLGQLGSGNTLDSSVPVSIAGNERLVSLSSGSLHTCGVDASHQGYCWGSNDSAQLGTGDGQMASAPVPVTKARTP
jgi:alpha-tubulin suppressor-like RCC1 family protein